MFSAPLLRTFASAPNRSARTWRNWKEKRTRFYLAFLCSNTCSLIEAFCHRSALARGTAR